MLANPGTAFVAMAAIVLVITGAKGLYADMGHFSRQPILRAWFLLVFPALTLNYLGQAALVLESREAASDPFFLLYPGWARLPMVVLATAATVIASQAVIAGAFSLTARRCSWACCRRLRCARPPAQGGQIYLPGVNVGLFVG